MPFEVFPYTNFHELNLDAIISYVTDIKNKAENIDESVDEATLAANNALASANSARTSEINAQNYQNNIEEYTSSLSNQVSSNTNAINVNSARIDSFTHLAEGSTTGDAELQDIRIWYNGQTSETAGDAVRNQIKLIIDGGSTQTQIVPTIILNEAVDGDDGHTINTPAYNATAFLEIPRECVSVTLTGSFASNIGTAFFDTNRTYISGIDGFNIADYGGEESSAPATYTFPIPENAAYVRASYRTYYYTEPSDFDIKFNISMTSIYERVDNNTNDIIDIQTALENMSGVSNLTNKKWIHCGDSFSDYTNATFTSGTYNGRYKSFPRLIALRNNMDLNQNFMLSGRTLAYPADGTFANSITCPTAECYYQNIPADTDYITIMLGVNDYQHTGSGTTGDGEDATGIIEIGTINDTTTSTYYGAYNTVLEWIRRNRPFAHVGIMVTNGTSNQAYTEAQIAIADKWGIPYINMNGDKDTPAMIRCYNPNIPTNIKQIIAEQQAIDYTGNITGSVNTHPNWQTHEYESIFIENWLKTL